MSIFGTAHLRSNLKGHALKGGVATMVAQALQIVLQLASTMVLARLLTPEDFGLVAMVLVVTHFAGQFRELGLSTATVQRSEITHRQITTLFWVNVGIGFLLMVLVAAAAPLAAMFFQEERLVEITVLFSTVFLLGGVTVQHNALLQRQMKFFQLAIIQTVSLILKIAVGVSLALRWQGTDRAYMALVWMEISRAAFLAIGVWLTLRWMPGLPGRRTGVRSMLRFGAHLTIGNMASYFVRNLDNILIGKIWGVESVGLYNKAYQIVRKPLVNIRGPVNSVAVPVLSRLQNDPERYKSYYGTIVFVMAFLSMPIMCFCALFPKELIELLLGRQWLPMSEVFRVLALAGFIQPVTGTRDALLISHGLTKLSMSLSLITSLFVITGFCVGVIWGPLGVAVSFLLVSCAIQFPAFAVTFRHVNASFRDLIGNCWHVALISAGSALCARAAADHMPHLSDASLLTGSLAFLFLFLGVFLGVPFTRRVLLGIIGKVSGAYARA